jgi:hypothetical protein
MLYQKFIILFKLFDESCIENFKKRKKLFKLLKIVERIKKEKRNTYSIFSL